MTLFFLAAPLFSCALHAEHCGEPRVPHVVSSPQHCAFDHATAGSQRLAVVVGVGQYLHPDISDLQGPPLDAALIRDTLVEYYDFDPRVCLLLDEHATTAAFRNALTNLGDRVDAEDSVAVYFAGHGSHLADLGGDEADGLDETLMFTDARHGGVCDLVDDELHELLGTIAERTPSLTVVLDSCNSGSAARGDGTPRYQNPPRAEEGCAEALARSADGSRGLVGGGLLARAVVLAAATDGTPALERHGRGVFTGVLVEAMRGSRQGEPTWRQIRRAVMRSVQGQRPWFHGPIDQPLFGGERPRATFGWNVDGLDDTRVALSGLPLPGWSTGARLRVYPRDAAAQHFDDPALAKAELEITSVSQGLAFATVVSTREELAVDRDLAVLSVPGSDAVRLPLRVRGQGAGALPEQLRQEVLGALEADARLFPRLEMAPEGGAFEVTRSPEGHLQLRGPGGLVRASFEGTNLSGLLNQLRNKLDDFMLQLSLRKLRGEGPGLTADQSLEVALVPRRPVRGDRDCSAFAWSQEPPNSLQVVPMCHRWAVQVHLRSDADVESLVVGGVILYNDGSSWGFPADGRKELLRPGDTVTFLGPDVQQATPPYGAVEYVFAGGTHASSHMDWASLSRTNRGSTAQVGALGKSLERFVGRERGGRAQADIAPAAWTTTVLPFRTELVQDFRSVAAEESTVTREYSVPWFDLRPYWPGTPGTALGRVLEQVEYLTYDVAPGYCQHGWGGDSDDANLTEPQPVLQGDGTCTGIDCSRALWFAFTRAGVPYPSYLSTWAMESGSSLMSEHFRECMDEPPRLGDLLVYVGTNAKGRDRRHVVMVIDPSKYVAWGSHGWDGSTAEGDPLRDDTPADVTPLFGGAASMNQIGVAFQMTAEHRDWSAWDWKGIERVACWRHKSFEAEAAAGLWDPVPLSGPCEPATCEVRRTARKTAP